MQRLAGLLRLAPCIVMSQLAGAFCCAIVMLAQLPSARVRNVVAIVGQGLVCAHEGAHSAFALSALTVEGSIGKAVRSLLRMFQLWWHIRGCASYFGSLVDALSLA